MMRTAQPIISVGWFFAPTARRRKRRRLLQKCASSRTKRWPLHQTTTPRARERSHDMALATCHVDIDDCYLALERTNNRVGRGIDVFSPRTIRSGAGQV